MNCTSWADANGRLKRFAQAAIASRQAEPSNADNIEFWHHHAAYLLLSGATKEYQDFCERTCAKHGGRADPRGAYLLARLCTLGPLPGNDMELPSRLIQKALAIQSKAGFHLHTLGMIHYRAGRYAEAARVFRQSLAEDPNWGAHVIDWLGLALASHKLGSEIEAQQWLEKSRKASHEQISVPPLHHHDWLSYLLLLQEAERELGRSK